MCDDVRELERSLRSIVAMLESSQDGSPAATELVETFATVERLSQAGRLLATMHALDSGSWRSDEHRSPAEWIAATTHTLTGQARASVDAARRLARLPVTRAAVADGALSELEAIEISEAAAADPASETALLQLPGVESARTIRERCREVVAAATRADDDDERIHRARYLRRWVDDRGAFRLEASLTQEDGAAVWSVISRRADDLATRARAADRHEATQAHAADALVRLVCGEAPVRPTVVVHVEHAALQRGHTLPGERSSIGGVGAVSVPTVDRLLTRSVVELLAAEGADVTRIVRLGRAIPWQLQRALEVRYPRCAAAGCDERDHLEIDHIVERRAGGVTSLENLVRLCRYHHGRKTFDGWHLARDDRGWVLRPPPPGHPVPSRQRFRRRPVPALST